MQCDAEQIGYFTDRLPDAAQVTALYREAGWITDDGADDTVPPFVQPMLKNSFAIVTAYDGARLVGMMRALSDGVSDAYLLDLVVTASYRKLGIGRKILEKLCAHLDSAGIDWIVWIGADGTEEFYKKTGATVMKNHIPYRFNNGSRTAGDL